MVDVRSPRPGCVRRSWAGRRWCVTNNEAGGERHPAAFRRGVTGPKILPPRRITALPDDGKRRFVWVVEWRELLYGTRKYTND